jgi:fructose-bisphosphate aldolase, class I
MKQVVRTLVAAGPDAIQLSVGLAPLLQSQPGRDKPALVLRSDVANVYGPEPPSEPFSVVVDDAVGHWSGLPGKRLM